MRISNKTTSKKKPLHESQQLQRLVSTNAAALENGGLSVDALTDTIMAKVRSLAPSQRRQLLSAVRNLVAESSVKGRLRLSSKVTSRIIAAIIFWDYACDTYAMNMMFHDPSRQDVWKKLARISGMNRNNVMSIVEVWDQSR